MNTSQTIIQSNPINNIGKSPQSSEVVQSGVQTQGQVTGLSPSGVRGNIMLDEVGGGNNRLRGDGDGNQSGGGRGGRSSVQFNIYGSYDEVCCITRCDGKDSTRPVGVFLPQDYGDNFMTPRYFGDRL